MFSVFSSVLAPEFLQTQLVRLLGHAWEQVPDMAPILADPRGIVTRFGDTLIWSGPSGERLLGGLESLTDSHARIESAVNTIETTQLSLQGVLGLANAVSITTLGITSLSGAFMSFRLQALSKRIHSLSRTIKDVEGKIDAQHKAHLKSSVQFLREYEDHPDQEDKLRRALDEARHAANIYGALAAEEAGTDCRLPVLNCRGRLYFLSLLTELRCMVSADDSNQALERVDEEELCLTKVAEACFQKTLGREPERYLQASFREHNVGLDLLTSVYQQAKALKVIDQPAIDDASKMFEYVRDSLQRRRSPWDWYRSLRTDVSVDLQNLRYLLACLEETSKIRGLQLLVGEVHRRQGSIAELMAKLQEWKQQLSKPQPVNDGAPNVFAYAF